MNWSAFTMEQGEGGQRKAYLMVSAEEQTPEKRAPLLINLVLDRSASMTGSPLAAAVDAAQQIVDQCTGEDYLGLLTFDAVVEQRVSVMPMSDVGRARMIAALRELQPGRGTALHQAVRSGAQALSRMLMPGRKGRLVLLTDGEPSVGPEAEGAFALLGEEIAASGLSLMPVGLGSHYLPEILTALARPSGNAFGHADGPDGLGMVMGGVFAMLQGESRNEASVRITPRELRVLELRHKLPSTTENGALWVKLGGMLAGQTRRILFEAEPASPSWSCEVTGVSTENGDQKQRPVNVERVWPDSAQGRLVRSIGTELDLLEAERRAWDLHLSNDGRSYSYLELAEHLLRELVALDAASIDRRRHLERLGDLRLALERGEGDVQLLARRAHSVHEQTSISKVIPFRGRR